MTRIVAGSAGSLRLKVPSAGTRPTSDRVREAIFSALDAQDTVRDARVLDLYAGSGALGLEAASRGAASVDLVERAAAAAAIARDNAKAVGRAVAAAGRPAPRVTVTSAAVQPYLDRATRTWDLVFVDPPYELGDEELSAALTALGPHLDPGAVVIVERSARTPEPSWPAALTPLRSRTYGETIVWWAARLSGSPG